MLEKFYPSHVIGRLTVSEEEFWEEKVSFWVEADMFVPKSMFFLFSSFRSVTGQVLRVSCMPTSSALTF